MSTMREKPVESFVRSDGQGLAPEPPRPPALPSLFALAEPERVQPKKGLFAELLRLDHLPLYHDMNERSDLYDDISRRLVDELAGGSRRYDQLDEPERRLLDAATLEFATHGPATLQKKREAVSRAVKRKIETSGPNPTAAPESSLPPFWWLG